MAKINLNNQQNQENPCVVVTLASLGVLLCMVVTVLGIKLWWFKHRLSFDQTTTQNGAAGGNPPAVVVPRRNKKQKYKDKRWSQQIYDSVEVHGVFRQKNEDDMEIQRPQQLPPVRIRQLSASTQSLILPPPRTRRGQVHSTAFEDMEIGTPINITPTASLTAVTNTNDSDTKLSLTFEEFEKQFKLKEIKPEIQETQVTHEVMEVPVPPLRLNRSSSAMLNPEKTQRFLKSSQSITIPEFHKVIERRPTGFSRPTEDLTRIDDYEDIKLFENFGERRPTGYIKYEEVDRYLTDQYELNQQDYLNSKDKLIDYKSTENGNWKCSKELKDVDALESLRNERIVYQNDLNESSEMDLKNYYFSKKNPTRSTKQDTFMEREYAEDFKEPKIKQMEILDLKGVLNSNENIDNPVEYEDFSIKQHRPTGYVRNEEHLEETAYKSIKDRRPTEFVRDLPSDFRNDFTEKIDSPSIPEDFDNQFLNWPQFEEKIETPKVNVRKLENHDFEKQTSVEESEDFGNKTIPFDVTDGGYNDNENIKNTTLNQIRSLSFERISLEHNESTDLWEEHEHFQKSSPTQLHLYSQLRSLMINDTTESEAKLKFLENENSDSDVNEISSIKQRTPTEFVSTDKEEYNQSENIEIYENRKVKFNYSDFDNIEKESNEISPIKQKRPTGFVRTDKERVEDMESFTKGNDNDYENDTDNPKLIQKSSTRYNENDAKDIGEDEIPQHKVKFENSSEEDYENYSLNKRRPTGFIKNLQLHEDSYDYEEIAKDDLKETKVKFSDNILDTKKDTEKCLGKQRRPTGYIKKSEMEELSDKMSDIKVTFKESTVYKESENNIENSLIKQRRPTGYIKKSGIKEDLKITFNELNDSKESESNSENYSLKPRRPTGFTKKLHTEDVTIKNDSNDSLTYEKDMETSKTTIRFKEVSENFTDFVTTPDIEKLFETSKQVNFNLNSITQQQDESHKENEALKTRRPTGYVRNCDITSAENLDQVSLSHSWPNNDDRKSPEIVDSVWQELENGLDHDFTQNIDEEFSKIRHSYELNEGDFLEQKNELSPTVNIIKNPLGFGKTIDDDWENFEKLKTPKTLKLQGEEQTEIQIIYNEEELNTTSILKETKVVKELDTREVEEVKAKPRKSKVTFDFKTEEHLIPARSAQLDSEEDEYYEDSSDYDDKPPPSMPPQPVPRLSNIKYNSQTSSTTSSSSALFKPVVSTPSSISLFGSQVSQEDAVEEDSWSAIRKHRNLTVEFQHISLDSSKPSSTPSSPPPKFNTPPPKPAYRNPLAQLAIQRAKEVKAEMGDFKARSIKDVKKQPEVSKRNQQTILNLHNDDFCDTEA